MQSSGNGVEAAAAPESPAPGKAPGAAPARDGGAPSLGEDGGEEGTPGVAARAGLRSLVELHQAGQRRIRCVNCHGALAALAIAHLCESLPAKARPLVAVVADEAQARALRKDLQFFLGRGAGVEGDPLGGEPVLGLPDLDISPWADASPERSTVLKRMGALFRLSQRDLLSGQVVVASVRALARRVVPKKALSELVDIIEAEEELDRDQTIKRLARSGYSRAPVCEDPGTYAVRGGVLDVFVPLYRFPVRIEFFGDLVESLRFYDPATQRTLRKTSEIYLHPVRETILTPGHRLRDRLLEELDYRNEAANQQRFVDYFAGHPTISVPEVLHELSTGRVLCTELAYGAKWTDVLEWSQEERNLTAETLYRFAFGGIYRLGVFNGDPHPGNYLFRPGGEVTFLDFGLCKVFTPDEIAEFQRLITAMVLHQDPVEVRRVWSEAGVLVDDPKLSDELIHEYFSHFFEMVLKDETMAITSEYASDSLRRFFDLSGPYGEVMKSVTLPSFMVVIQRINLGLYALFGELRAVANWRRLAEEVWPFVDRDPTTPMGEASRRWEIERGYRSAE